MVKIKDYAEEVKNAVEQRTEIASDLEATGKKIRQLREQQNLTQEQLAEKVGGGCSEKVISRYETAKTQMRIQTLYNIAAALRVSPVELTPSRLSRRKTPQQQKAELLKMISYLPEDDVSAVYEIVSTIIKKEKERKNSLIPCKICVGFFIAILFGTVLISYKLVQRKKQKKLRILLISTIISRNSTF